MTQTFSALTPGDERPLFSQDGVPGARMPNRLLQDAAHAEWLDPTKGRQAGRVRSPDGIDRRPHRQIGHLPAEPHVAPVVRVVLEHPEAGAHAQTLVPFPHAERLDERRIDAGVIAPLELVLETAVRTVREKLDGVVGQRPGS